jgi:hypothetical protein
MKPPKVTQKKIAQALGISTRRVTQLIKDGLPVDSIAAAEKWRAEKAQGDSTVEALRAERILLIRCQRERVQIENDVRSGELLLAGDVQRDSMKVCSLARDRFLRLSNDLPPRLEGLAADKIAKIIHETVTATLEHLCRDFTRLYSSQDGQ